MAQHSHPRQDYRTVLRENRRPVQRWWELRRKMQASQCEISGRLARSPVALLSNQQSSLRRSKGLHAKSATVSGMIGCGTAFAYASRFHLVFIRIIYARRSVMYPQHRARFQSVRASKSSQASQSERRASRFVREGVGTDVPCEIFRCLKFESDFACPPVNC
jgi:hypothetical protein